MTQFITLPQGGRVAYHRAGTPEVAPLVLLHGFCENQSVWQPILPYLSARNVICLDLPGFGESDVLSQASIEAYAEAVHDALHGLDIAHFCLVGHSLGGYTALAFAEKYPERLLGLGLVHSHPFADDDEAKENREQGIAVLEGGKKEAYVAQLFDKLFAKAFASEKAEVVAELVTEGRQGPAEGMIHALQAMMARPERASVLEQSSVPVFFALGEADILIPQETVHKMIHLPARADIHLWPDVAHMGMYEAPERLGPALNAFAERVGA